MKRRDVRHEFTQQRSRSVRGHENMSVGTRILTSPACAADVRVQASQVADEVPMINMLITLCLTEVGRHRSAASLPLGPETIEKTGQYLF